MPKKLETTTDYKYNKLKYTAYEKKKTLRNQINFVYLPSGYTCLRKWKVSDKQIKTKSFSRK